MSAFGYGSFSETPIRSVFLSAAKDFAPRVFEAGRDSLSPAAPQNDSRHQRETNLCLPGYEPTELRGCNHNDQTQQGSFD